MGADGADVRGAPRASGYGISALRSSCAVTSRAVSELEQTEGVFNALAHPQRRQILLVLRFRGGEMTAGEIAERFACSWPTTSRHLRILERAKMVRVMKRGRQRVYKLDRSKLRTIVGKWLGWFDDQRRSSGNSRLRARAKRH
jgi:DNA-binding transcriptional ArsR family regulator